MLLDGYLASFVTVASLHYLASLCPSPKYQRLDEQHYRDAEYGDKYENHLDLVLTRVPQLQITLLVLYPGRVIRASRVRVGVRKSLQPRLHHELEQWHISS